MTHLVMFSFLRFFYLQDWENRNCLKAFHKSILLSSSLTPTYEGLSVMASDKEKVILLSPQSMGPLDR